MISDTVRFMVENGREVIYDAEHFFDGWKRNPHYALSTLQAAVEAGASLVVLCDTNGGSMPEEIASLTKAATDALDVPVGIHCHNDCDLAVANSMAAVDAGAVQVQGTINGFGERCGNADLVSVAANLGLEKARLRTAGRRRRGTSYRVVPVRIRNRQHALSPQPALCWAKRICPQRGDARACHRPGHEYL